MKIIRTGRASGVQDIYTGNEADKLIEQLKQKWDDDHLPNLLLHQFIEGGNAFETAGFTYKITPDPIPMFTAAMAQDAHQELVQFMKVQPPPDDDCVVFDSLNEVPADEGKKFIGIDPGLGPDVTIVHKVEKTPGNMKFLDWAKKESGAIKKEEELMHKDSKGRFIKPGDQVMFRGRAYTIFGFGAALNAADIYFVEDKHVAEIATGATVELILGEE